MKKIAPLLALLTFIQLAHVLDFVMMLPLGPRLQTELHLTPQQFAALVSAYTFAAGVTGFLGAFVIDRFDRKWALVFLYAGFAIGTGWCGIAHGFQGLMIARILAGAFGGLCGTMVTAIVADVAPPEDRGKALGIVGAAFPVASVLGVPLAIWLAGWQGWQAPFIWLFALASLSWSLVLLFLPKMRGHMQQGRVRESPWEVIIRTWRHVGQRLGLGLMATQSFGHFALVPLLSTFLVRNVGFTEAQLPLMYLVGGGLQFGTNPLAGWLADKFGRATMFIFYSCTAVIPLLWLSNLGQTALPLALVVTTTFFILSGSRFIPASALLNDQVESNHRGSYMGFVSCVQQIASGLASYIAGWIVTEGPHPTDPLLHFDRVGYFCLFFTTIGAFIAWRLKKTGVPQHAVKVDFGDV